MLNLIIIVALWRDQNQSFQERVVGLQSLNDFHDNL